MMISKCNVITRNISCLLCLFLLFLGCGQDDPPQKTSVVRKKISQPPGMLQTEDSETASGYAPKGGTDENLELAKAEPSVVRKKIPEPPEALQPGAGSDDGSARSADEGENGKKQVAKPADPPAAQEVKPASDPPKTNGDKIQKDSSAGEKETSAPAEPREPKKTDQKKEIAQAKKSDAPKTDAPAPPLKEKAVVQKTDNASSQSELTESAPEPDQVKKTARPASDKPGSPAQKSPDTPVSEPLVKKTDAKKTDAESAKGIAGTDNAVALLGGITQEKKEVAEKKPYDPKGKIDPFAPLFKEEQPVSKAQLEKKAKDAEEEEKKGKKKKKRRRKIRIPRTPLEKVDLSQLKLVGIIHAQSGGTVAMVEEASGKGYIIKEGTPIGIHGGRVAAILRDRVVVREEEEDVYEQEDGDSEEVKTRDRELKLPKPLGEEVL
ncbi:pilus assembly protein PilP [Desulfococcaceae bacterium HSG8]|nr:pilus assembly protein PilP [Desulfococcaceae bacterium HSG8]